MNDGADGWHCLKFQHLKISNRKVGYRCRILFQCGGGGELWLSGEVPRLHAEGAYFSS